MPENDQTTTTETAVTPDATTEDTTATKTDTGPADLANEVEKWKALSRKNEERAKANAAAAKKLEDIEAAQLSETEKLTKRVEEAEKRAAELESQTLKTTVSSEKGVPADLLSGSTREELEASADRLLKFAGDTAAQTTTTDFGAGRPGSKDIGDQKAPQLTREALKSMTPAEIKQARTEGRLADLLKPKK